MNSDGAYQLLDKSKAKFKDGDSASALRMVNKSIRMHKTPEAVEWLLYLGKQSSSASPPAAASTTSDLRNRKPTSAKTTTESPAPSRPYTPEQA
jgi:outer membrane protein assembly factor BamD (BamD/ComL family)